MASILQRVSDKYMKPEERSKHWDTMVNILDSCFEKGKCQERGQAMVFLAYVEMLLRGARFDENGLPLNNQGICRKCEDRFITKRGKTGLCSSCVKVGKKQSEKTRIRRSETSKGRIPFWLLGKPSWNKNKEVKVIQGEKHWNWKGGISVFKRNLKSLEYKSWRLAVFERDKFVCQDCGQTGGYLEAHHKKRWSEYPELRYEVSNGQTLCKKCHNKTKGKKPILK